jgi:hypothetical protein
VRAILAIDENERVVRALAFANGQRGAHAEQQLQQREFEPFIVEGRAVRVVTALAIRWDRRARWIPLLRAEYRDGGGDTDGGR